MSRIPAAVRAVSIAASTVLALTACGGTQETPALPPSTLSDTPEQLFETVYARWSTGRCPEPAALSEATGMEVQDLHDNNPMPVGPATACLWGDPEHMPTPGELYTMILLATYDSFESIDPIDQRAQLGADAVPVPGYGPDSFSATDVDTTGVGRCTVTLVDAVTERAVEVSVVSPPVGTDPCEAALAIAELP